MCRPDRWRCVKRPAATDLLGFGIEQRRANTFARSISTGVLRLVNTRGGDVALAKEWLGAIISLGRLCGTDPRKYFSKTDVAKLGARGATL
jgi:hypothetical protein